MRLFGFMHVSDKDKRVKSRIDLEPLLNLKEQGRNIWGTIISFICCEPKAKIPRIRSPFVKILSH